MWPAVDWVTALLTIYQSVHITYFMIWTRDLHSTKPICYQLCYPGLDFFERSKKLGLYDYIIAFFKISFYDFDLYNRLLGSDYCPVLNGEGVTKQSHSNLELNKFKNWNLIWHKAHLKWCVEFHLVISIVMLFTILHEIIHRCN